MVNEPDTFFFSVVEKDALRDIPADKTLHFWKLIEITAPLLFLIAFAVATFVVCTRKQKELRDPSRRIRNIVNLDRALERLKLYKILSALLIVSQMFSVCDLLLQLASTCYGSSIDMDLLTGHPLRYAQPEGFEGPLWLQKMLFNLNFLFMKSGGKFIDIKLSYISIGQRFSIDEYIYNGKIKSAFSVLTGRLRFLDSYLSPALVMSNVQIIRQFFKSLFGKKNL